MYISCITAMEKIIQLHNGEELEKSIQSNQKALVLFLGTCEHCNPGKERFESFVKEDENKDVHYFKILVADKPDLLEKYHIKNRPTVHIYINAILKKSLEREEITAHNLKELL